MPAKLTDEVLETTAFKLPRSLMEELRRQSDLHGVNMSMIMREALEWRLLGKHPQQVLREDVDQLQDHVLALTAQSNRDHDTIEGMLHTLKHKAEILDAMLTAQETIQTMMRNAAAYFLNAEVRLEALEGGDVDAETVHEFKAKGRRFLEAVETDMATLEAQHLSRQDMPHDS